ncbi:hypothetical protein BD413DRAFT_465187, partial [Trametes elegans]
VPFGVTYEKIGTIQRRLAWPLHKDDTLSRSGRPTGLNIYFAIHAHCGYVSCSGFPVGTTRAARVELADNHVRVQSSNDAHASAYPCMTWRSSRMTEEY